VVLIVVAILGAVTLIAWLLKPMVAKRLRAATPMTTVGENGTVPESRQWHDSWQATRERDAEQQDSVPESADQVLLPSKASDDDVIENETPEAEASSLDASPTVAKPSAWAESDSADIAGITETVRTLLDWANAGRVRDGFALYTDAARERFRADTGLTVAEFATAFEDISAPPSELQAELAAVTDVDRLPDGRIRAMINYRNGETSPNPEYFTFVRSASNKWLIDEIETTR